VNEGIPSDFFAVKYSSFDDAVSIVRYIGIGCFMSKIDVKHAFRLCPVHPSDWPLLGYKWLGKYLFDIRLPFRSRSSPFIFNIFADALTWILVHKFNSTTFSFVLLLLPSVNRKFPLFWMSFVTLVFPLLWINLRSFSTLGLFRR